MFIKTSSKIILPPLCLLTLALSLCITFADTPPSQPADSPLSSQNRVGTSAAKVGLAATNDSAPKPLKALLIAGGCCHDYEAQHRILYKGIQERANIRVDVMFYRVGPTTRVIEAANVPMPIFKDPDWAKGYDVVIHDECVALKDDEEVMTNILKAHETIPAVHLHCAMHSFRGHGGAPGRFTGKKHLDWCKHIGLMSIRHGPHVPVSIRFVNREHPITKGFQDWVTEKEELYNNEEVYGAEPLAVGTQKYQRDGKEQTDSAVVIWTNTTVGAPSFSTSLGHYNHNVEDPRYLDLVTRGALWVCGKLDDPAYQKPYTGSNLVRAIPYKSAEKTTSKPQPPKPPAGAIAVKLSAKSVQADQGHYPWHAVDNDPKTRWCGAGPEMPSWLQVKFDGPTSLTGAEIEWEIRNDWMQYTIETSTDGKNWTRSFDASANQQAGPRRDAFTAKDVRFVRVNLLKQQRDMWPSLCEFRLYGSDGKKLPLYPRIDKQAAKETPVVDATAYQKAGNIPPRAHRLAAEEEAELLKDVAVPDGFTASLFAPWQMANYPTGLAAAPDGDLYVSSDGNASGGRDPGRGRVLRLRDTDRDGRADEVTEFVRQIDSPRGILWDHDRLFVLHPPHITVFHDQDGDGVADSSERLISNIAFGFKDRPADHTTNGLEMGIDGWIYVAVGDFGFMKATGTDGRTLQMRGGGVVRFRPDGTGLETFSDGTRNIYGIAISPTLDFFARDNTNDGAGWNVRLHHFTGLEDHGYPRLFKNFTDEAIAPLADYGGGSGCGAFYLDEPGIPDQWNQSPYTIDWGREGSFHHALQPTGATFKESAPPERFFKMTRPTDGDVDGQSAIYQSSWKGPAQFTWKGPDHGYIARMAPANYTPQPLPDFARLSDAQLVELIRTSPSHVRRLNAQRMLLRRAASQSTTSALLELVKDSSLDLARRVAALYAISQRGLDSTNSQAILDLILPAVKAEDALMPFVTRACGDMGIDLRTVGKPGPVPADWLKERLHSDSPRQIIEAIVASTLQGKTELSSNIAAHLSSDDPEIVHTAYRALAKLGSYQAALPLLDSEDANTRKAASWALMRMHQGEVVSALLERLSTQNDLAKRRPILSALARLYHREAPWAGESWGTRPDSRGPYYQPATWEQSPRILSSLNAILESLGTTTEEASFIVAMMGKNRIQNDESLDRFLTLAEKDATLIPTVIDQLAEKEDIPPRAVPFVLKAARSPDTPPSTLKESVRLLMNLDHGEVFSAVMAALDSLQNNQQASKQRDDTRDIFLASTKLENHYHQLAALFLKQTQPRTAMGVWSAKGLLQLAHRQGTSLEAQQGSRQAIAQAWSDKAKKITLLDAAFWSKIPYLNDRIRTALDDPDPEIVRWAERAAGRLRIQKPGADKTPKIATLKPEEAIAQVLSYKKGDFALGEAIFTRATCIACHTVRQDAPQTGPYLGSIVKIYRRQDLAEAIILPNKSIAQGFKTNLFILEDGKIHEGFVTDEAGDTVTIRDISSKQHTFQKSDIAERDTLPNSLMPSTLMNPFSIHEFASLLDYLEHLAKK